jgi:hypothetical protein
MLSLEAVRLIAQTYEELKQENIEASRPLETMRWAYQQTCAGKDPWTGLGCFSHAWYGYAKDNRAALISEPLEKPEQETEHTRRWAAFCAASVEFLCERYHVPCPHWVYDPSYTLPDPWWRTPQAADPGMQADLRRTTPAPFKRRNIFCGNRIFQNKYEQFEWTQEAMEKGLTDPNDIRSYVHQKEVSIHGG